MSPPIATISVASGSIITPSSSTLSLSNSPTFLNNLDQLLYSDSSSNLGLNNSNSYASYHSQNNLNHHVNDMCIRNDMASQNNDTNLLDNTILFNISSSPNCASSLFPNINNNNSVENFLTTDLFDSANFSLEKLSNNNLLDCFNFGDSISSINNSSITNEYEDDESDESDDDFLNSKSQALAAAINNDLNSEGEINDGLIPDLSDSDALIAIREMAKKDKLQQQRKHKNSTSSISSVSMSSTIKKFAKDLQNTANNLATTAIPVPINNNNFKNASQTDYLSNNSANNDSIDLNYRFDDLDHDFSDFLELEGWEQMLDEDCISRLTADFNTSLASECADSTSKINNESANTSSIASSVTNNFSQIDNLQNLSSIKNINNSSTVKMPNALKFPTATVLSSSTTIPKLQNLSSISTFSKTQPLVVLLSSTGSSGSSTQNQIKASSNNANLYNNVITTTNKIKKINFVQHDSVLNTNCISAIKQENNNINSNTIKKVNSVIIGEKQLNKVHINSFVKSTPNLTNNIKSTSLLINNNNNNNNNNNTNNNSIILKNKTNTSVPSAVVTSVVSNETIKANNSSNLTNNVSSTGNSNSSSNNSSNSLIDCYEVIDCINPDQIFPNRSYNLVKNEFDFKQKSNLTENKFDDESEEEIDVVSINSTNNSSNSSTSSTSSHLNLNHHNYFHPIPSYSTNKKSSFNQQAKNLSNNENKELGKNQSSLLAKCLKSSTEANKTSKIQSSFSLPSISSTTLVTKTIPKSTATNSNRNISNNLNTNSISSNSNKKIIHNNFIKTTKLNNNMNDNDSGVLNSNPMNNNLNIKQKTMINTNLLQNSSLNKTDSSPSLQEKFVSNNLKKNSNSGTQSNKKISNFDSSFNESKFSNSNLSSIRILTTTNNAASAIRQLNQTNSAGTTNTVQQEQRLNIASKSGNSLIINSTTFDQLQPCLTSKFVAMTATKLSNSKSFNSSTFSTKTSNTPKIIATTPCTNISSVSTSINQSTNLNGQSTKSTNLNSLIQNNSQNIKLSNNVTLNTTIEDHSLIKQIGKKAIKSVNRSHNKMDNDQKYHEDDEFDHHLNEANDLSKKLISNKGQINSINFNINSTSSIDDDEDIDDIDEVDDEDEDDECSNPSSPSSTLSPSSMTSNISSGCSTPTKNKINKNDENKITKQLNNNLKFDFLSLNEKLNKKNKKKTGSHLTQNTSKRNNRLNSLGYSSDNPAEKRAFHILSERQRRNDLKKLFETLRTNIPNLSDKQKASKLTILKAAVDHLVDVSNKREKLSSIYDKEKQKHAHLLQHLKNLQQQQAFNFHNQTIINSNSSNSNTATFTTLAVH